MALSGKTGILLVNTGTPAAPTPRAVRSFLSRFLIHRRIAPMNRLIWWWILHLAILPRRGRASADKYAQIWTEQDPHPLWPMMRSLEAWERSCSRADTTPKSVWL